MNTSIERQATVRFLGCCFGVIVFAGCAAPGGLHVATPAADSEASARDSARPRAALGMDDPTRKTNELLAAAGATKLEGLKPMQHGMGGMQGMDHSKMGGMKSGRMEGMDHSKMPGTKGGDMEGMDHSKMPAMQSAPKGQQTPRGMENMDHSKMPGMKDGAPATDAQPPPDKQAVAEEMKKLSDEMKKTSDELKKKSDAAGKPATPAPQP